MFIWFIIIQMHINTHTPPLLFLTSSVLSFWHCSSWGLSLPSSLKFAFSHSPQELELSQYVNHCIKLSGGCAAVFFSFQLGDTFIHSFCAMLSYPIASYRILMLPISGANVCHFFVGHFFCLANAFFLGSSGYIFELQFIFSLLLLLCHILWQLCSEFHFNGIVNCFLLASLNRLGNIKEKILSLNIN